MIPASATRLRSLDVFRGATMAGMVIVNNPGDWNTVYAPLLHAAWNGWTPTDLIFPFFLFIVGVSMAQASAARLTTTAILTRGVLLVGIGLFMAGFPFFNPARWRIPGVLARIGVCFIAAGLFWRAVDVPGNPVATVRRLAAVTALCLLGYWGLLTLIAPPGGTAGDLTPEGNLGAWLDRALFGRHLWKPRWDPEGLLSSVPAVGTTLMGLMTGLWIRRARPGCAAPSLVYLGAFAAGAGLLWGGVFPINKSLWTSSYALFTGGAAAVVLGVLHMGLDDGRASAWALRASEPFVALGRNALLLFVLSGLAGKTLLLWTVGGAGREALSLQQWIYTHVFTPLGPPRVASLLFAAAMLAWLYALLTWLHHRRWYWSV